MAQGRTVSANFLTEKDKRIIQLCEEIGASVIERIEGSESQKRFKQEFGKISYTRDAGTGQGGGKLQRDALCTRGIQGKAPFSNRNLRWHPLVVSKQSIPYAKAIKRIDIEGEGDSQTLVFVIEKNGKESEYPASKVHELPERYAILPEHWQPHLEKFRLWNDSLWTQNSCVIAAFEACEWHDAVESFGVLAISAAVNFFDLKFELALESVINVLRRQTIDSNVGLPSSNFPMNESDISECPLCRAKASAYPANLAERERDERWKPEWSTSKRSEGDDRSMQIMHIEPLTETEIRHHARNVRFGHRWCNVAMTDHSVEETLNFMEYVLKAHRRG